MNHRNGSGKPKPVSMDEVRLLRRLERIVLAGHAPMKDGKPDHRVHGPGCDWCETYEELKALRKAAA